MPLDRSNLPRHTDRPPKWSASKLGYVWLASNWYVAGAACAENDRAGGGRPAAGCEVAIVERDTRAVRRDGELGEIWVKGPHVAQGYWNNPEQTAQTFGNRTADGAGPYLATGDLGFLHDGALVVTGRCKDVIILRGDNYYPSDLEASATAAHPALVPDGAAAFTLAGDEAGSPRIYRPVYVRYYNPPIAAQ